MARFGVKTQGSNAPTWQTYLDEGDGDPIRFLVADWTRTAQEKVSALLKDHDYLKGLGLVWDANYVAPDATEGEKTPRWTFEGRPFPYGTGDRKAELRTIVTVNFLVHDWTPNVTNDEGTAPLVCDIVNKVWLFERQDLGLWLFHRGQEGGAKVIEGDAKN